MAIIFSAQISYTLPIAGGIPFTAQSLVIFVIASLLSPKESLICLATYLALGLLGLPVFAGGASGLEQILGTSGGFLYGFLFSAFLISYCVQRLSSKTIWSFFGIMLIATLCLFFFGLTHLGLTLDFDKALQYGLIPFWKMALVKAVLAAVIAYYIHKKWSNHKFL